LKSAEWKVDKVPEQACCLLQLLLAKPFSLSDLHDNTVFWKTVTRGDVYDGDGMILCYRKTCEQQEKSYGMCFRIENHLSGIKVN